MSLADKVAALRALFGVQPELQLLPAVEAMHAAMGSVAEGPLPAQGRGLLGAAGGMNGWELVSRGSVVGGPGFLK